MVCVAKTRKKERRGKKKSPEAARADLQGCANKPRDAILPFLCLGRSDAISCCCLAGPRRGARGGLSTARWELMAPSLGRASSSAVPLPTRSLPVARHCGAFLPAGRAFARAPGSPRLQQRPGGCARAPRPGAPRSAARRGEPRAP